MATPTTKTFGADTDANIMAALNTLGLSVVVTAFSSTSGGQPFSITFSDVPQPSDLDTIQEYFSGKDNWVWT